jgi:hypothetical protein
MTVAPGLNGTTAERMREALAFCEEARRNVSVVGEPFRNEIRREYALRDAANRTRTDPKVVERDANYRADHSIPVQMEIGKEQWGTRLATMYAAVRQVEQNAVIIDQNRRIIDLLSQLLNAVRGVPPSDVVEAGLHDLP